MCGIIGFITKETHKNSSERRRFFNQALLADQFRGEDATGLFTVAHSAKDKPAKAWWYKQASAASTFVTNDLYQKTLLLTPEFKYMVGHNRFGTHGTKELTANAHPFTEGPITLVHNGGLHSMHELPTPKHKLDDEVQVDSHVICHNLALHSVKDVVAQLNGAYVLVWHDERDDSLNIIRNAQRPLAMAKDRDSNTIYFASEAAMLMWVAERNSIRIGDIMEPRPGHWLKFTEEKGLKPVVEVLPMYTGNWQRVGRAASFMGAAGATNYTSPKEGKVVLPFVQGTSEGKISSPGKPRSGNAELKILPPEQVMLNKRYIDFPCALENNLASYSIDPQDTYIFTPCEAQNLDKQGRIYGRVQGLVETGEVAYMHNVMASTYHSNNQHDWVVAPLALLERTSPSGKETETIVVVRPFKYFVPEGFAVRKFYLEEDAEEPDYNAEDPRLGAIYSDIDYDAERLRGPKGLFIPKAEWMEAVKKGCCQCAGKLYPRMEDEIIWLSNGDPVCPDCVDAERIKQFMKVGMGDMS